MPKILHMFRKKKSQKGRLRRALGLPEKPAASIIVFPQISREIQEEYPDYEIISRWLKLADEMLGSADDPRRDDYHSGSSRKPA